MKPADGIVECFEALGRRGHQPLLAKVTGRMRFDLVEGGRPDRWLVAVDKGHTTVEHEGGPADCAIRADEHGLTFELQLGGHGSWSTGLDVVTAVLGPDDDTDGGPTLAWRARRPHRTVAPDLARWLDEAPAWRATGSR